MSNLVLYMAELSSLKAGSTYDYILDTYTGSEYAYSFRKLKSDYTGACLRIGRTSDSTETDIPFSGNYVSESAIASFCSGTTGYIVGFKDQTGNNKHATMQNSNVIIYENGAVIKKDGFVHCRFAGGQDSRLNITSTSTPQQTLLIAIKYDILPTDFGRVFGLAGSVNQLYYFGTKLLRIFNAGGLLIQSNIPMVTNRMLISFIVNGANSLIKQNGATVASGNMGAPTGTVTMIGQPQQNMFFSELISYPTGKNADLTNMETQINTYYSIF